ncbi:glycosyltransferase [Auraticoccus sp. F435]|uniref:Glycosyltransferase n=1 Tax=Auraticoccus cholistanensis TaxID=2656650 RepID=A0A6A9UVM5_9ACTN|nr:glycosyltransferase [Auraticoccus cholistanensis]MVA76893.1 glycosyltransferase [Auraticoccus cholistanensis]
MRTAVDHLGRGYTDAGAERILVVPGSTDEVTETGSGIVVRVRAPRLAGGYRMIAQPWRALDVLDQFHPTSVEVSDKWTLSPVARWASRRGIGSVLFSHERLDAQLSLFLKRPQGRVPGISTLNSRLAKAFDAVVVTSAYAADEWAPTGANLVRVPLGVDLETFHPDAGAPVDDGVLKLVYIGRLSREKSPHLAVATAVELHRRGVPVRLDVYGTGPHLDELRQVAGDAPVVFHGYVGSRAEIARRFAAADIALSVCPVETFGLAVLEGLASGVPVVTSDRGGARELVDASSGEWGRPDPASLADAVLRLAARDQQVVRRGARARAERYRWSTSVERMLELHGRLAEEVPHRPLVRRRLAS